MGTFYPADGSPPRPILDDSSLMPTGLNTNNVPQVPFKNLTAPIAPPVSPAEQLQRFKEAKLKADMAEYGTIGGAPAPRSWLWNLGELLNVTPIIPMFEAAGALAGVKPSAEEPPQTPNLIDRFLAGKGGNLSQAIGDTLGFTGFNEYATLNRDPLLKQNIDPDESTARVPAWINRQVGDPNFMQQAVGQLALGGFRNVLSPSYHQAAGEGVLDLATGFADFAKSPLGMLLAALPAARGAAITARAPGVARTLGGLRRGAEWTFAGDLLQGSGEAAKQSAEALNQGKKQEALKQGVIAGGSLLPVFGLGKHALSKGVSPRVAMANEQLREPFHGRSDPLRGKGTSPSLWDLAEATPVDTTKLLREKSVDVGPPTPAPNLFTPEGLERTGMNPEQVGKMMQATQHIVDTYFGGDVNAAIAAAERFSINNPPTPGQAQFLVLAKQLRDNASSLPPKVGTVRPPPLPEAKPPAINAGRDLPADPAELVKIASVPDKDLRAQHGSGTLEFDQAKARRRAAGTRVLATVEDGDVFVKDPGTKQEVRYTLTKPTEKQLKNGVTQAFDGKTQVHVVAWLQRGTLVRAAEAAARRNEAINATGATTKGVDPNAVQGQTQGQAQVTPAATAVGTSPAAGATPPVATPPVTTPTAPPIPLLRKDGTPTIVEISKGRHRGEIESWDGTKYTVKLDDGTSRQVTSTELKVLTRRGRNQNVAADKGWARFPRLKQFYLALQPIQGKRSKSGKPGYTLYEEPEHGSALESAKQRVAKLNSFFAWLGDRPITRETMGEFYRWGAENLSSDMFSGALRAFEDFAYRVKNPGKKLSQEMLDQITPEVRALADAFEELNSPDYARPSTAGQTGGNRNPVLDVEVRTSFERGLALVTNAVSRAKNEAARKLALTTRTVALLAQSLGSRSGGIMRKGEPGQAGWEPGLRRGQIYFKDEVRGASSDVILLYPDTSTRPITVNISEQAAAALKEYFREMGMNPRVGNRADFREVGDVSDWGDPIFFNTTGEVLTAKNYNGPSMAKKFGLPVLQDMRKLMVTEAEAVQPGLGAKKAGHADVKVTEGGKPIAPGKTAKGSYILKPLLPSPTDPVQAPKVEPEAPKKPRRGEAGAVFPNAVEGIAQPLVNVEKGIQDSPKIGEGIQAALAKNKAARRQINLPSLRLGEKLAPSSALSTLIKDIREEFGLRRDEAIRFISELNDLKKATGFLEDALRKRGIEWDKGPKGDRGATHHNEDLTVGFRQALVTATEEFAPRLTNELIKEAAELIKQEGRGSDAGRGGFINIKVVTDAIADVFKNIVKARTAPPAEFTRIIADPMADLPPMAESMKVHSQPWAWDYMPIMGRVMGGMTRFSKQWFKEPLMTFYVEREGIAPARAAVWSLLRRNAFDSVFKADPKTHEMNVQTTRPGQSKFLNDVIEGLRADPNSYILTPEQRAAFNLLEQDLKKFQYLADKYRVSSVAYDAFGNETPWFGRIRTGTTLPGREKAPHRAGGLGGRASFQHGRKFTSEAEGRLQGQIYETSIEKTMTTLIKDLYQKIAEARFRENPVMRGLNRHQAMRLIRAKNPTANKKRLRGILRGWAVNAQVGHGPLFRGRYFPVEKALELQKELKSFESSSTRHNIATLNSLLKATALAYDFGVSQLQLLPTAFSHPWVWAQANISSMRAMFDKNFMPNYTRRNLPYIMEMVEHGKSFGQIQEFLAGIEAEQPLITVPRKWATKLEEKGGLPGAAAGKVLRGFSATTEAFGRQFQTALDVAAVELWKAWRDVTPKGEWGKVIKTIEAQLGSGRMESSGVRHSRAMTERVLLLASSYYRGAANFMGALTETGRSGYIARRNMFAFMAGSTALYYGVALALGMDEDEIKERMDPSNSKFMMWKLKSDGQEVNIGFGGIYRSVLRLAGEITEKVQSGKGTEMLRYWGTSNPITKFGLAKAAPFVSAGATLFTEKDFLERRAGIEKLGTNVLPLTLQDAIRSIVNPDEPPITKAEVGAGMLGMQSFPHQESRKEAMLRIGDKLFGREPRTGIERYKVMQQYETEQTPKSVAQRERYATLNVKKGFERERALTESLPKADQEFMKRYGLVPRQFKEILTVEGVEIPLTDKEQAILVNALKAEYATLIRKLRNNRSFINGSKAYQKAAWDEYLNAVHEKAKAEVSRAVLSGRPGSRGRE